MAINGPDLKAHAISPPMREVASETIDQAAPWLEGLARFGYWCKGAVYITIGLLTLLGSDTPRRGEPEASPRGAIETLATLPLGQMLTAILALGLLGYAVWQTTRAMLDPERQGRRVKGLVKRAGYLISAGAYLALTWFTLALAVTGRSHNDPDAEDLLARTILNLPAGQWLVGLIGTVFLAVAANQLYVASRALFMKRMRLWQVGPKRRELFVTVGRIGIAARGGVAAVMGSFLIQAAWEVRPERAGDIAEALRAFANAPFGQLLVVLAALGMIAYGLHAWVQAALRRIHIEGCLDPADGKTPDDGGQTQEQA